MATYRAYVVGSDGHFAGVHLLPDSDTDNEALRTAEQYVDGCDVQVWNLDRHVATISSVAGGLVYKLAQPIQDRQRLKSRRFRSEVSDPSLTSEVGCCLKSYAETNRATGH